MLTQLIHYCAKFERMRWPNNGEKRKFQTPAHFNKVNKDTSSTFYKNILFKAMRSFEKKTIKLYKNQIQAEKDKRIKSVSIRST